MIQNIIVGLLFASALFYVGRMIYRNFTAKSACDSGCGKCSTIDVDKIEKQLKKKAI
jgi:hypothetical protein